MTNKEYIDYLLKSDLSDFNNLQRLFDMIRLYESENFEEAHKINKMVKTLSARYSRGTKRINDFFKLNKITYLFDAKYDFESFLVYLEWDREPEKRFYLPRRKIMKGLVAALQKLEDDVIDILTISLPPGIGKTTLGCFFLAWVMGKYPDSCNLASAHGDKLTKGFFEQVYSIIVDPEYNYRDIFPDIKVYSKNTNEETIDLNRYHRFKTLTCRSIGGGLTGSTRCEKYLYCDDLVSGIEEALNVERLNTLWGKYTNDLKSRKKKLCKEIHIATRWSIHDVIGRIQTQYGSTGRCMFISVPALDEKDESNFDYLYDVGFSTDFFKDMRDSLDDISWRCLYQQEPIEREGLLFPEDLLKTYNGVLPGGKPDKIFSFCDVAWGGGDYLSMPIAYKYGEDVFIHDVVFNNKTKDITKPIVAAKIRLHNVHQVRFEANNGGDEYADDIDKELRNSGFRTNITHRKAPTTNSKVGRIVQAAPDILNLYFLDKKSRTPEYNAFIKNLTGFTTTTKVKNDDAPDSLAGLVNMIFKNYGQVSVLDRPF